MEELKIIIINGPNLNLLGKREPSIYGRTSFETFLEQLQLTYSMFTIHYFQSNHEGALIDKLHEVGFTYNGIILNPGAYAHTSVALADAVSSIETPVIEVHISNIFSREAFRQKSLLAGRCVGLIAGLGLKGYELALEYFK